VTRKLRILFVVQHGALLRFALLIPAIAGRGHEIHIAFPPGGDWRGSEASDPPQRTLDLLAELQERFPGSIEYGPVPDRAKDGWSDTAWLVRGLADLAHNANPRYKRASVLRKRTRQRVLGRMEKRKEFEPIGRALAVRVGSRLAKRTDADLSRKVLGVTAALEDAVPSRPEIDQFVREAAPDVVVVTGTFRHVSSEVELLKSARALGIPAGIFVTSWDNLTNKGSLKFVPERVFVWNEVQARDAVELHRIPRDRVVLTGAHVFDEWFERRPTRTREELLGQLGLDPTQPYLVYLCSSGNIGRDEEPQFVQRWVDAIRSAGDERLRRMNLVVRPHPNVPNPPTPEGHENVVVWPPAGAYPVASEARDDFFDTLFHSAAVVGMNTTAMIEAAILGKSVLTVLVPDFAQETTLHFHYLLSENGGFLHVASGLDEHLRQLSGVLDDDELGAARRRAFVESFVRPRGLDRPAAPTGAEAIEELASLPARSRPKPGTYLLRGLLSVEAGLNAVHNRRR
jgi:hypothetical protein